MPEVRHTMHCIVSGPETLGECICGAEARLELQADVQVIERNLEHWRGQAIYFRDVNKKLRAALGEIHRRWESFEDGMDYLEIIMRHGIDPGTLEDRK